MAGYYQIGWSAKYGRDIRLQDEDELSGKCVNLRRIYPSGNETYIRMTMAEAMRLYNALGQILSIHQTCRKEYQEPDRSVFEAEDDSLGSD